MDETVQFDREELLSGMIAALKALGRGKPKVAPLWSFDYNKYLKMFLQLAEMSGISALAPHPYALRHGGASDDFLSRRLTIEGVRRRGRWRAMSSVRRYEKSARVALQVQQLPAATRRYGMKYDTLLNAVLSQHIKPEAPPFLTTGVLPKLRHNVLAATP
jgi:hypothetical protein